MKHGLFIVLILTALCISPVLADTTYSGEFTNITIYAEECPSCTISGDTIICAICPLDVVTWSGVVGSANSQNVNNQKVYVALIFAGTLTLALSLMVIKRR